MRAKFQVLVLPFAVTENDVRYCVFKRPDMNFWQFVLGGGEEIGRASCRERVFGLV